jgi:hypothetical protein
MGMGDATAKISALRAAAFEAADDQGVVWYRHANLTPTDVNALAFSRTTAQVLNIVYLGGTSGGYGFFPQGVNGAIAWALRASPAGGARRGRSDIEGAGRPLEFSTGVARPIGRWSRACWPGFYHGGSLG